jgi:membrane-associated phospholipid phosphatase
MKPRTWPRYAAMSTFVRARFAPGMLGLHMTMGATLIIAAVFAFGSIAEEVMEAARITVLDLKISNWFHAHGTPLATTCMMLITNMNGVAGVSVLSCLFAAWLYHKKSWHWLLALFIAVPGGMLLNVALKYAFHRTRPSFDDPLLILTTYSFPSGHTSGATLFYGMLAAYLISSLRGVATRTLICVMAIVMVLLVGLSRIYLGAHYFSDVLAAVAVGSAWLALTLTAVAPWYDRSFYRFGRHA